MEVRERRDGVDLLVRSGSRRGWRHGERAGGKGDGGQRGGSQKKVPARHGAAT